MNAAVVLVAISVACVYAAPGLVVPGASSSIRRADDAWGNSRLIYAINSPATGDIVTHSEVRDAHGNGASKTAELAPNGLVRTRTVISDGHGGSRQVVTGGVNGRYVQSKNWVLVPALGKAVLLD